MIQLNDFLLKEMKDLSDTEQRDFMGRINALMSSKYGEYAKAYEKLKITGQYKTYAVYDLNNNMLGLFYVYGMNPKENSAWLSVSLFSDRAELYAPILIQGGIALSITPDLGYLLETARTALITLSKDDNLDSVFKYSRLLAAKSGLMQLEPELEIREIDGIKFAIMTVTKNRIEGKTFN